LPNFGTAYALKVYWESIESFTRK